MTTTVIETYQVAPPPGAVAEQTMPLAFFDMTWLHFHPMLQILFYEFPCSKQQFLESVVPNLKQSLSLTLKHFLPYSCKIVYPSSSEKLPKFRYLSEDSVPFVVAESSDDFDSLVGSRTISAARYYSFVPKLPPIVEESDQKVFGVLSVQVTLFPGRGIGIGINKHHSVADAPSVLAFISGWAEINKHGGDEELKKPVIDRTVVKYPTKLNSIYWERALRIPLESRHPSLPTDRIRTTFVLSDSDIKKLKGSIQSKVSINISSFVAIAAYIWKGITKITKAVVDDDEELAYFMVLFDLRPRLDPPVPENYFGNCLTYALPRVGLRELVGDEGVFVAAEAIAAEIKKKTSDKRILDGIETRSMEIREAVQKSFFSVAGSSRLDLYGADFGWGKARKQEILSIDGERYAMTMCKARDVQGGVEVCLSLPKDQMEAFDAYFSTLQS